MASAENARVKFLLLRKKNSPRAAWGIQDWSPRQLQKSNLRGVSETPRRGEREKTRLDSGGVGVREK